MQKFKTVMSGKPAMVRVKDDESVQVLSVEEVWGFTPDLKPAFYDSGAHRLVYTFDDKGDAYAEAFVEASNEHTRLCNLHHVQPENGYLVGFDKALKAILAVPAQTPLPARIQAKLASQLSI